MKKWSAIWGVLLWAAAAFCAESTCAVRTELPLQLMGQELTRNMKILKKQTPPIYYLAYTYNEGQRQELEVSLGGRQYQSEYGVSRLDVLARAGSVQMDNTRALKGDSVGFQLAGVINPVVNWTDKEGKIFRLAWWRATQAAVEQAQKDYSHVTANVRSRAKAKDQSNDFVLPPVENYCRTQVFEPADLTKVKELLEAASAVTREKDYLLSAVFSFSAENGHRYFADSLGTRLKTPYARMRLFYQFAARSQDGLDLERFGDYNVFSADELPSVEQLQKDVERSLAELESLLAAPQADPASVPAILKGRAAGVFVHEVLGHRLEGHRQKDDEEGQTFTGKVGQQVISPLITVVADPTLRSFNGAALRGYYEYDDEGVKARPVTLIENGILKNFLMSSSPIAGFPASNGHGRKESAYRPVARMSVLRTTAAHTVPYEKLEEMLVQEIRRQGKPYGLIIEDLGGGFTFTSTYLPQTFKLEAKMVYRIYPDGRKEPVRGVDVVGTPLVSFNKVLAAGDDDTVFDGSCGAESGWVPQTNIAPSLLFEALETEKSQNRGYKPPVLPSPLGGKRGTK